MYHLHFLPKEPCPTHRTHNLLLLHLLNNLKSICIPIIVSQNSVIFHCFDTKSYIWYRIFFENSTIILSMAVTQNCIYEKQFCWKPIKSAFAKRNCVSTDYSNCNMHTFFCQWILHKCTFYLLFCTLFPFIFRASIYIWQILQNITQKF